MQTRSNNGPVEDSALGQVLGGDNESAENSFRRTIPKAPQGPARDNFPPVDKGVQLLGGQKTPKNPGAMGTGNPIEVDIPPDNKGSSKEEKIVAEIE